MTSVPVKRYKHDLSAFAITRRRFIPADELARPPANAPEVVICGIAQALAFTVDTDKAYYKIEIPDDWYPNTDIELAVFWTRSSTGDNDSGKAVKWQITYLLFSELENCNASGTVLSVEDTYDSASTTDQIVYKTDVLTVPASSLSQNDILTLELMAVTPTGTALSEPACVGLEFGHTAYQIPPR